MVNPQDFRAAFQREKPHHPEWPDTFEDACHDPAILRVLIESAREHVPAFIRKRSPRETEQTTVRRFISGKDRAAGERDDDDDD